MNCKIEITPEHLDIVIKILNKYLNPERVDVHVFGSRAKGAAKRCSDLDLAVESKEPVSLSTITAIRNDFENSILPYAVDIIDLDRITSAFKKTIKNDLIKLPFSLY
jgi:predicted nucleotidyltransferase